LKLLDGTPKREGWTILAARDTPCYLQFGLEAVAVSLLVNEGEQGTGRWP